MAASNVRSAKTYSTIAVAWTVIVGVLFLSLGFILNQIWIMGLGVLSIFIAMMAFITTSERLRREETESARLPCIVWGILLLALGAAAGVAAFLAAPAVLLFSFLFVFGGVFMIFAHSKIAEARFLPSPPPLPPPPIEGGTEPGAIFGYLTCLAGDDQGAKFNLTGQEIRIGNYRDETNHVRLRDRHVSRRHARIFFTGEGAFIEDLGSRNGTYVNEKMIPPQQREKLSEGAQIGLGPYTRLAFSSSIGEEPTVPT